MRFGFDWAAYNKGKREGREAGVKKGRNEAAIKIYQHNNEKLTKSDVAAPLRMSVKRFNRLLEEEGGREP